MCGAFEEKLPDTVIATLECGDIVVMGNFDWGVSWLIMYLTSSQISHVAVYTGNGKVLHATLGGSVLEPLQSLFSPSCRLALCKFPMASETRQRAETANLDSYVDRPYTISVVLLKALDILSGRDIPYFRWKFFVDIALAFFLIDLTLVLIGLSPFLYWGLLGYAFIIVLNQVRWRYQPFDSLDERHGKPCDVIPWILASGGSVVLDPLSPWFQRPKARGGRISEA